MAEHKSMYLYSAEDAKRYGKLDLWRESYKENCKCARAIEDAIQASFDGFTLQPDCAQGIIQQFGFNRVNLVLSNTLRQKQEDGRFSPSNKAWSKSISVPRDSHNWAFAVKSHPAVLDGFVSQTRKAFDALQLYDASHCESLSGMDLEGKVLVVSPNWLKDSYKTADYQLFLAQSGFGCSPTAAGRKVFGQFLYDGEQTHLTRSDFIGILKEELLPQWAREKLEALEAPKVTLRTEQTM